MARQKNGLYYLLLMAGALSLGAIGLSCSSSSSSDNSSATNCLNRSWSSLESPQIQNSQYIAAYYWNDPTVIKENGIYKMWLSGGDPTQNPIVVKIFLATSADGISWNLNTTPVFSPSSQAADWDSERVETPSILKVGSTYHLYYSACKNSTCAANVFSIGHATSSDGVSWTRDPGNPVISPSSTLAEWGGSGVGEPFAYYNQTTSQIYLYYVAGRPLPSNTTVQQAAILLAKSSNGSSFTKEMDGSDSRVILTKDIPGASNGSWYGYSTPALVTDLEGKMRMFYSLLIGPTGASSVRLMSIQTATSLDGINFTEETGTLLQVDGANWINQNVRSPAPLIDGNKLRLWFAGETLTPVFQAGIGEIQYHCP